MSDAGNTTLRLSDTSAAAGETSSLWLVWAGLGKSRSLRLQHERIVLGREADGEGRLNFPGVSRQHLEIFRQGPLFAIRDLQSTNGTFLNGQRVTSAALSEGDVLRLGDAVAVTVRVPDHLGAPDTSAPISGVIFTPGLASVLDMTRRVAPGSVPVVLEGPTGVGKEGVARVLHALSGRSGALHAVNCGALPEGLAEAELFGYRKGAFTGAERPALGHIRAADRGTLFLDELVDLPGPLQVKLLRVLQEQRVVPLGETRAIPVDVRIVTATVLPITDLVARGRLRDDLAARLTGATVRIPPLAERRGDIPPLLAHFLREHSRGRPPAVDGRLLEHLLLRPWPGNVRELELLVRRLLAPHGAEPTLRRSMLQEADVPPRLEARVERRSSDQAEPDLKALRQHLARHGNVSRAAREAGISRQRAYRLLGARSPRLSVDEEHDATGEPELQPRSSRRGGAES